MEEESFFSKHGFALLLAIICTTVISIVITNNMENLIATIDYHNEKDATGYATNYRMIGYSDNNMSNTPLSANIENGILKVKGKITNKTGKKLKLKDYAVITFGGYEYAGNVNFDGDGNLNNNSSLEVTFETNVSNLKDITVLPTTVHADLGTLDSNNRYHEFDLKYVISWY
jgi:hypothetical protein